MGVAGICVYWKEQCNKYARSVWNCRDGVVSNELRKELRERVNEIFK